MSNNSKPWHVLDLLNISSSHHIIRHRLAADEVLNVVRVHKGNCQDTTAAVDLLIVNSTAHMLLKFIPKLGWQVLETSSSKLCIVQVLTSLIQHEGHNLHHLGQLQQQEGPLLLRHRHVDLHDGPLLPKHRHVGQLDGPILRRHRHKGLYDGPLLSRHRHVG